MKNQLYLLVFALLLCSVTISKAQEFGLSSIQALDPPKNHYKTLNTMNAEASKERAWMDTIAYPPEKYRNNTLLFALTSPTYLSSSQLSFLVNAVNYPANSSEQTRAELDFLLELQNKRTKAQEVRVMEIAKVGYWPDVNYVKTHPKYTKNLEHLFWELREVIGKDCSAEKYPATAILLQGIMGDMRLIEFAVKYHLLRARPYQLDTHIKPLKEINSPSFASGHTLWAYMQAFTLAELIPEKRKEFLDLAYEVAFSRELMGVHYPSDEEIARQLSHRAIALMWNTTKFQEDFMKAKKEWY